jgi:hypothetical protein
MRPKPRVERSTTHLSPPLRLPRPNPHILPVAGGREIISVDYRGERTGTVRCLSGPVIFVALGRDGLYSTESVRGRFESIDKLMHAFGASWPSPCTVGTPYVLLDFLIVFIDLCELVVWTVLTKAR